MSAQLQKSQLQMFKDLLNAISSPESEDGHSHCNSQEYQQVQDCGQEVHRVNHSVPQGSNSDSLMSDTLPRCSSISSASASLQSSLGNKLRQQLENRGCAIYKLTWKEKTTPSGLPYSQLVALAHRTSEIDCSLERTTWPTPTTRDHKDSGDLSRSFMRNDGKMRNDTLYRQMWLHTFGPNGKPTKEQMVKLESFHPIMARQIMGFPPEWDACAVTAMPLSRKSQRNS